MSALWFVIEVECEDLGGKVFLRPIDDGLAVLVQVGVVVDLVDQVEPQISNNFLRINSGRQQVHVAAPLLPRDVHRANNQLFSLFGGNTKNILVSLNEK